MLRNADNLYDSRYQDRAIDQELNVGIEQMKKYRKNI